ncbi:thiamine phosphate synthase [Clostridium sp. DL1XJH146]
MEKEINYSLYLVTDRGMVSDDKFLSTIEEAILGGVSLVQIREKQANSREFYEIGYQIKEITDKYNVPLIVNDRVDIAIALDATGVHVGQSDLPAKEVRKIIGEDKIVGVSVANIEEALKAKDDGADYLGVGAMYPTGTKQDTRDVTLKELKEIKEIVGLPIVAIGGINLGNTIEVMETGIDGIAVVSAIMKNENPKKVAEEFINII